MNKLTSCLFALCALCVATNVYAQSAEQAPPEEVAVRAAYDHASYAVELGIVNQYVFESNRIAIAETLDDRLARNAIHFTLSILSIQHCSSVRQHMILRLRATT